MIATLMFVAVMSVSVDPSDANNPDPAVVRALAPKLGALRQYNNGWVKRWVSECQSGHVPASEGYCKCMLDSSRFFWNFKQIKRVTSNVRNGRYVPERWFEIDEICWQHHEKRQ